MPITWQNINAPSNEGVMRGFAAAGQGITAGFDQLGKVIADRQAVNQGVENRSQDAMVLSLKEALAGAKTPEEVMALQGQLGAMREGMSNKSRAAVLGADEARTAAVQQQITAANAFTTGLRTNKQSSEMAAINDPVARENAVAAAALAPSVRNEARLSQEQAVSLGAINRPAGLVVAGNAAEAARLLAERAPAIAANAKKADLLAADTLTVNQQTAINTLEDQNFDKLLAQRSAQYQESKLQDRQKLGELAKARKFQVDATGAPDMSRMTSSQVLQLNADAGLAGLRSTADLYGGDTKASNDFVKSLSVDGKFSPAAIARNRSKIDQLFNSTGLGKPIGDDAQAIKNNEAMATVLQKEKDGRNWYAPGSNDALTAYESLALQIEGHSSFKDSPEDLADVHKVLNKFATRGIEVKPGTFVTPSVQDIMGAVRGTKEGWNILNSGRSKDIEAAVKKVMESSFTIEKLADREASTAANRIRDRNAILQK